MPCIAHLSDVHLDTEAKFQASDFLSPRIYGYLKWRRQRERYDRVCLAHITNHVKKAKPDLTVVSGDIVNMGLPQEYKSALEWLRSVGSPDRVCVVPPGGDPAMRGALKFAHAYWDTYIKGLDLPHHGAARYPYIRKVKNVAVICCSGSITDENTNPRARHSEMRRLFNMLRSLKHQGYFRVVTIDQNPTKSTITPHIGDAGAKNLRHLLRGVGAELILHAHQPGAKPGFLGARQGVIPIVGVSTASGCPTRSKSPARYHQFHIEGGPGKWNCVMQDIGYSRNDPYVRLRNQVTLYSTH